jgi:tetraacyldisaccharide 4'-kinase
MKTPSFWYQNGTVFEKLLSPLSTLYNSAQAFRRVHAIPQKIDIPVISIGNLTAGGSGKTPTAIAISKLVQSSQLFLNPHFVTRGYGGMIIKPELINDQTPVTHCGDEAILLQQHAKTIVARNRFRGARYARDIGADLIIMDDGLQNRHLKSDLSFCIIDGTHGFGNGQLIPAGPLREPIKSALKRIHAIIMIGDDKTGALNNFPLSLPVFRARVTPNTSQIKPNTNYIAFCGLGLPQKFYQTLSDINVPVVGTHDFADHHDYTDHDIETLIHLATKSSARLITTEKDFVKIKSVYNDTSLIDILPISLSFDDTSSLISFIQKAFPSL